MAQAEVDKISGQNAILVAFVHFHAIRGWAFLPSFNLLPFAINPAEYFFLENFVNGSEKVDITIELSISSGIFFWYLCRI